MLSPLKERGHRGPSVVGDHLGNNHLSLPGVGVQEVDKGECRGVGALNLAGSLQRGWQTTSHLRPRHTFISGPSPGGHCLARAERKCYQHDTAPIIFPDLQLSQFSQCPVLAQPCGALVDTAPTFYVCLLIPLEMIIPKLPSALLLPTLMLENVNSLE